MCLAIPARIEEINENRIALADILGVKREISLDLTPQVQVGDFALVHAGYAIEIISEEYAEETLALIRDFPEFADESF